MLRSNRLRWLTIAAIVLCGCSSEKRVPCHPVRGQILLKDMPAEGMVVVLNPKGAKPTIPMLPNGPVEADGTFSISTYGNRDGAPLGEYGITLLFPPVEHQERSESVIAMRDRYAKPDHPVATFTVCEGENDIPLIKLK